MRILAKDYYLELSWLAGRDRSTQQVGGRRAQGNRQLSHRAQRYSHLSRLDFLPVTPMHLRIVCGSLYRQPPLRSQRANVRRQAST